MGNLPKFQPLHMRGEKKLRERRKFLFNVVPPVISWLITHQSMIVFTITLVSQLSTNLAIYGGHHLVVTVADSNVINPHHKR